jgi:GntR family transcriptional repressor for pyruvate dehydrogenase complex
MLTNTVALKLIQYIVDKNLPVGTKLPSIRELATLWDSNPSQVRTGLITLSALGIIDMHPRAGSFVKQLSSGDLDMLFVLFFRLGMLGKQEDVINLYSIKAMLDQEVFINAIKYRTNNDLYELEQNLARQEACIGDCAAFIETDEQFHVLLAKISRNSFVVFLLEAIQGMLRPYRNKNFTPAICRESWESHMVVFSAIESQNESDAEKIAVLHTQAGIQRIRANKEASNPRSA